MNKVTLLGRLAQDPEIRYTNNGKAVTNFTMAVDRGKDKGADFIPVVFWDKTAETIGNYVKKGQRLLIEGRLQVRSYENTNGEKRRVTEVVGNYMEFIEKAEKTNSSDSWDDMGAAVEEEIVF